MFIGPSTLAPIKEGLLEEIDLLLPQLMQRYASDLSNTVDIEKMVSEKVEQFSSDKLEQLLVAIMSKEFRFVEIVGAVLGLLIGIIQIFLAAL